MTAFGLSPLLFLVAAATGAPTSPTSPAAPPADLSAFDETRLAQEIWAHGPDVIAARPDVFEAETARRHSYMLPNPSLSAAWGTIPLGRRTGDPEPEFADVPNYSVGISELIEIGKRGPRQKAAEAARAAAGHTLQEVFRQSFYGLMDSLTDQAVAVARASVLRTLVATSQEVLRLQRARAERGDLAGIEVDRLEVEDGRLLSDLRSAEAAERGAQVACTRMLGRDCPHFETGEQAQAFLLRKTLPPAAGDDKALPDRPDLRALRAQKARIEAEQQLSRRLKIPDLVAGVTYTYDRFLISGNQSKSLTLNLTIPLPLFDHGQAELDRTTSLMANNEAAIAAVSTGATRARPLVREQITALLAGGRALDERLPVAAAVVERMNSAFNRGGVALLDVLSARRDYENAQLDRIEVAAAAQKATTDLRRVTGDLPWRP
jgi:cobalt-zinc-cadmium efflux system outer membrane protein